MAMVLNPFIPSDNKKKPPVFAYTGNSQFIDEGNGNFMLKILSSGTLNLSRLNSAKFVDIFMVGGGQPGGSATNNCWGGNGGQVKVVSNKKISHGIYNVVVGGSNQNTTIFDETAVTGGGGNGAGAGAGQYWQTSTRAADNGTDPWKLGTLFGAGGGCESASCYWFYATDNKYYTTTAPGQANGKDTGANTGAGGHTNQAGYSGIVIIRNHRG